MNEIYFTILTISRIWLSAAIEIELFIKINLMKFCEYLFNLRCNYLIFDISKIPSKIYFMANFKRQKFEIN